MSANPRSNEFMMTETEYLAFERNSDIKHEYYRGVVCGDSMFTDDNPQALLNPILIIEVLSSSTEQFDRGAKFRKYRQLDSLREYVLVSQEFAQIERFYLKENDIWEFTDTSGLDSNITLKSIDCTFSLADVYANVVFEPDEP